MATRLFPIEVGDRIFKTNLETKCSAPTVVRREDGGIQTAYFNTATKKWHDTGDHVVIDVKAMLDRDDAA